MKFPYETWTFPEGEGKLAALEIYRDRRFRWRIHPVSNKGWVKVTGTVYRSKKAALELALATQRRLPEIKVSVVDVHPINKIRYPDILEP